MGMPRASTRASLLEAERLRDRLERPDALVRRGPQPQEIEPLPPLPGGFGDEYLGVHFSFAYEKE